MSEKPITGLFAGLFGGPQSEKAKEGYRWALEEAAREVASWDDAEVSNKRASNQKESDPKCWIN